MIKKALAECVLQETVKTFYLQKNICKTLLLSKTGDPEEDMSFQRL